ncbi:MAG: hypothetical protein K0S04_238 [Herbinix sp.]|jgi:preprotein translocase subunit SecE|nr:hypothetical protein [Herbinix sp.]
MNFHNKKTQRIISTIIVVVMVLTFMASYVLSVLN